jgi:hypothetical protein
MILSKAPFVLMNFTFVACFTAYFLDFLKLLVGGYLNRKAGVFFWQA